MKTKDRNKYSLPLKIWQEKCPHCSGGKVFRSAPGLFQMPEMNERCSECDYKFDREPGYFLGAMYISYGIAVLVGLLTFLILHLLFPGLATIYLPLAIIFVILLIAKKNYKLSRIIYIHMFPW